MDSSSFNNLQAEKANAILKNRKLRRAASLLRLVEVCVVLVLISRLSLQLPVAVKNSSEYFRDFSGFMVSPRFVFLIGNVIIITLFAQSGQFSAQDSRRNTPEPDLYQEFIQNSTKNHKIQVDQIKYPEKQSIGTEDSIENQEFHRDQLKHREKQSIRTEDSINNKRINGGIAKNPENHRIYRGKIANYGINNHRTDARRIKLPEKQTLRTGDADDSLKVKDYRRCHTEILNRVHCEKPRSVLQRCESENRMKSIEAAPPVEEAMAGISYPEDDMSNEEFRRTVEEFIARQQRLRREEDYSLL